MVELSNDQSQENVWINPVGGYGDILMLSGVLKLKFDHDPKTQYNLVRRVKYLGLLEGHPAISRVGFPRETAGIITPDYWAKEPLGPGSQRAFQILACAFGLETPVKEKLYLPDESEHTNESGSSKSDPLLNFIPWKRQNVLIAPSSDSPRKIMGVSFWQELVAKLADPDRLVVQAGRFRETYIRGAYSLLGITCPRQLINLLDKFDLVVTSDNFVMHAAHLKGIPTVALFGPTDARVYGYHEQLCLQAPLDQCRYKDKCLGPDYPDNYAEPCPLGPDRHCMNQMVNLGLYDAVFQHLEK